MIRLIATAGNNDSRIHDRRVYCCADAVPARVFTQPGPQADILPERALTSSLPQQKKSQQDRAWWIFNNSYAAVISDYSNSAAIFLQK